MNHLKHTGWMILVALLLFGCGTSEAEDPFMEAPTPTPPPIPTAVVQPVEPTLSIEPLEELVIAEEEIEDFTSIIDEAPTVTLEVDLTYYERWMKVRQVVEVVNRSSDPWDEVVFNVPLHYNLDAFHLDTVSVTVGGDVLNDYPTFTDQETILRVPLPRPAEPDETVRVEFAYRIVVPPVSATDWPPRGTTGWRYDQSFDLIQVGEWYPALVPYIDGEGWYTWRYHPVGDPTVYPIANYRLDITAEEGVTIASGGLLSQEGGTWHFAINGGRGIAFIASDDYELVEQEIGGVPVRSYYLTGHAEAGQQALDVAAKSLMLFSALYGPYPYDSLTVAENGFFGGMEYSGFASITDYAYMTYIGQPASVLTALVAHEVAHQWWYGAVGNDQANEPWIDESLAFYSEQLYFEHYHPDFVSWWWQKRVDQYDPQGPVDVSIYKYNQSSDFILWMYGQAARFIRDLRESMGDEAFFAFLKDYYREYYGQIVTGQDFYMAAQSHAPYDLKPVFEKYFTDTEALIAEVEEEE